MFFWSRTCAFSVFLLWRQYCLLANVWALSQLDLALFSGLCECGQVSFTFLSEFLHVHVQKWPWKHPEYLFWGYKYVLVSRQIHKYRIMNMENWLKINKSNIYAAFAVVYENIRLTSCALVLNITLYFNFILGFSNF